MPIAFSTAPDVPSGTDVLGIAVFTGPTIAADAGVEVDVSFLTRQGFEGKVGETLPLLADDGGTVIAVGVGDEETIEADELRRAAAAFAKAAWQATSAAFVLPAGLALD